jgi:hypothetical protein
MDNRSEKREGLRVSIRQAMPPASEPKGRRPKTFQRRQSSAGRLKLLDELV